MSNEQEELKVSKVVSVKIIKKYCIQAANYLQTQHNFFNNSMQSNNNQTYKNTGTGTANQCTGSVGLSADSNQCRNFLLLLHKQYTFYS